MGRNEPKSTSLKKSIGNVSYIHQTCIWFVIYLPSVDIVMKFLWLVINFLLDENSSNMNKRFIALSMYCTHSGINGKWLLCNIHLEENTLWGVKWIKLSKRFIKDINWHYCNFFGSRATCIWMIHWMVHIKKQT